MIISLNSVSIFVAGFWAFVIGCEDDELDEEEELGNCDKGNDELDEDDELEGDELENCNCCNWDLL